MLIQIIIAIPLVVGLAYVLSKLPYLMDLQDIKDHLIILNAVANEIPHFFDADRIAVRKYNDSSRPKEIYIRYPPNFSYDSNVCEEFCAMYFIKKMKLAGQNGMYYVYHADEYTEQITGITPRPCARNLLCILILDIEFYIRKYDKILTDEDKEILKADYIRLSNQLIRLNLIYERDLPILE